MDDRQAIWIAESLSVIMDDVKRIADALERLANPPLRVDAEGRVEMAEIHKRYLLPDEAFADPERRHFPHHHLDGSVDMVHVRHDLMILDGFGGKGTERDVARRDKIREHLDKHMEE